MHLRGQHHLPDAVGRQRSRGLADSPFSGMHTVGAAGKVGSSDVLACNDQVGGIGRNERAERDLEGASGDADPRRPGWSVDLVHVDSVIANAAGIGEVHGRPLERRLVVRNRDVLLEHADDRL